MLFYGSQKDYSQDEIKDRYIKRQKYNQNNLFTLQDSDDSENYIYKELMHHNFNISDNFCINDYSKILQRRKQKFHKRKIPLQAFRVLEAPNLKDDFYLNVVDWGKDDNLLVGLGEIAYTWNFHNNEIQQVGKFQEHNNITCVSWNKTGDNFVLSTNEGQVQLKDSVKYKLIHKWNDHVERVGALSLFNNLLLTGSRDRQIYMYDIRCPKIIIRNFDQHDQEVCGLKWNPSGDYFASGGNDNRLFVFHSQINFPIFKKTHKAAVKALDWSKNRIGVLSTGGGTADRCIRTWNLSTQKLLSIKDTGSQICNLVYCNTYDEIITSHGFSDYDINIWDDKSLKLKYNLKGHQQRVLFLSISTCGNYLVSGAGDETLRFWKIGAKNKQPFKKISFSNSVLNSPIMRQLNFYKYLLNLFYQNKLIFKNKQWYQLYNFIFEYFSIFSLLKIQKKKKIIQIIMESPQQNIIIFYQIQFNYAGPNPCDFKQLI